MDIKHKYCYRWRLFAYRNRVHCGIVDSSLRFGGGLWLDIKRKVPWFCSDIYDGFHIQSISAVLFIYLGCITNAITFGGLLGDATDNYQVPETGRDMGTQGHGEARG